MYSDVFDFLYFQDTHIVRRVNVTVNWARRLNINKEGDRMAMYSVRTPSCGRYLTNQNTGRSSSGPRCRFT